MKDKSYQQLPLGPDAVDYLHIKKKRLTEATQRDYESSLDKFVRHFPTSAIADFEPPDGARMIEEYLAAHWGERAGRTYNKNLSIMRDFFRWQMRRGALRGDPTLTIERAKPGAIYRLTFTDKQRLAIFAAAQDERDVIALRLLLDYGIRKGALQNVRLQHFDEQSHRLTIFTKGAKVFQIPIPDQLIWDARATLLETLQPHHFLLCRQKVVSRRRRAETLTGILDANVQDAVARARKTMDALATPAADELIRTLEEAARLSQRTRDTAEAVVNRKPDEPMGDHGLHLWWYRCLERAEIVEKGVRNGRKMHFARHSAGQRVLDITNNLKAVQVLLCHANIGTTAAHYVGWEMDQLETTMREVIEK